MAVSKLLQIILFSILILTILSTKSCSDDPNSSGTLQTDSHICTCKDNYYFRETVHLCYIDCNKIQYAIPNCQQPQQNIQTCICQQNYEWQKTKKICVRSCKNDKNSLLIYNQNYIQKCLCAQGYLWNKILQQCARDCTPSATNNLNGYLDPLDSSYKACRCSSDTYKFNDNLGSCIQICGNDPNTDFNNNCNCITGFALNQNNLCARICTGSAAVKGDGLNNNIYVCQCNVGYKWDTNTLQCVIDCTLDQYSDGTNLLITANKIDPLQCTCIDKFIWSTSATYLNKCIRNCDTSKITYSDGTNKDITTCNCIDSTYNWQISTTAGVNQYQCVRNCDKIHNSFTDYNKTYIDECMCLKGYKWMQTPSIGCISLCNNNDIPHATGISCQDPLQCLCQPGFSWDADKSQCLLNCSSIQKTDSTNPTASLTSCNCMSGFTWNGDVAAPLNWKCVRNCDIGSVKYSDGTNLDYNTCNCVNSTFKWEDGATAGVNQYQCVRNCDAVANSDTDYKATKIGQCNCLGGYIWTNSIDSTVPISCKNPCNTIDSPYSTGTQCQDPLKCTCDPRFNWQPNAYICKIDCSQIPNTNGNVDGKYDQCICINTGETWDLGTLTCQFVTRLLLEQNNSNLRIL